MKHEGEVVQEGRSVNVVLKDNSSRLFKRSDIRLDFTKRYLEDEEEELSSQLVGTGLEARSNSKLVENIQPKPGKCRSSKKIGCQWQEWRELVGF